MFQGLIESKPVVFLAEVFFLFTELLFVVQRQVHSGFSSSLGVFTQCRKPFNSLQKSILYYCFV